MFEWLRTFWEGRILFYASGSQLPRFLNQASKDGIIFYRTQKSDKGMRAQIKLADFRRLRKAARLTNTRIHLAAKYGWPFVAVRWWRRKGLLIGIALIGMVLVILSQLVLTIRVVGNRILKSSEVLTRAEKLGLKNLVYAKSLDLNGIAKALQEQLPDAAWVGIERNGTEIKIRIQEKIRPIIPNEAGDLVASRAGVVNEIIVIQGTPQVHEGETVRAGQVLIAKAPAINSSIPPAAPSSGSNNQENSQPNPQAAAAKGFVRGRVWYSAEEKVPLAEDKIQESGRQAAGYGIKIGSSVIMVTMPNSPYTQTDKEVAAHSFLHWRNWRFPVEGITITYKELRNVHIERTVAEARQMAEQAARAEVHKKITPGVTIVQEMVRVIPGNPGVERVRVEVETYEDLAVYANP